MAKILLTRTSPINAALAEHALFDGHEVFDLPLMRAEPIGAGEQTKSLVLGLDQFDDIFFISQNAVSFGLPHLENYWPQWPLNLRWFAVGSATASALTPSNVQVKYPETASSEGLLQLPELQSVAHRQCLIVRGEGGRETLKEELQKRGAEVTYLEVYRRVVIAHPKTEFPSGRDVVALVYSGEALQHLYDCVGSEYQLIVPSSRLQNMAKQLGFDKVGLANSQADNAMLEILENTLRQGL